MISLLLPQLPTEVWTHEVGGHGRRDEAQEPLHTEPRVPADCYLLAGLLITSQGQSHLLEISLYTPCFQFSVQSSAPLPSILTTWLCEQQEKITTTNWSHSYAKAGPGKPMSSSLHTGEWHGAQERSNLIWVPGQGKLWLISSLPKFQKAPSVGQVPPTKREGSRGDGGWGVGWEGRPGSCSWIMAF